MRRRVPLQAGVVLTKPELEVAAKVVKAEIVNHPQEDPGEAGSAAAPDRPPKKKGGGCAIQ